MIKKLTDSVLKQMSKQELCDYCRAHKIKGYSGKNKAQRVDLILNFYKKHAKKQVVQEVKSIKSEKFQWKIKEKEAGLKQVQDSKSNIRYMEYHGITETGGVSKKFYEIYRIGSIIHVRYGRIKAGFDGKKTETDYGTSGKAIVQMNKTINSKLRKGYKETVEKFEIETEKYEKNPRLTKITKSTVKPRSEPSAPDSKRINPMLAAQGEQYMGNPNYIAQQKYDGTRCIIIKRNETIKMIGRSWKSDYAPNFPEIVADIRKIPHPAFILDSELTFFKGKKDVFLTALAKKESKKGYIAKCMVFDILEYRDKDVRDQTLAVRSLLLSKIIPKGLAHLEVVKSHTTGHKKFFEGIISDESQGEGIVLKRLDSKYNEGGRTKDWIKVKGWKSDEAIIVGVTYGTGARDHTFGALVLAQYYRGSLKFVGKTSGFSEVEQQDIIRKIKPHKTITPQVVGISSKKVKYWVNPEVVVEVKFQERTSDGKFRFPSFLRLRTDKLPKECNIT